MTILHVDMDAFYASVEELEHPELRGKPLIVGGTRESRGVVAAANYVARRFGIHSAMPSAEAFRRCPELISLPPRIDEYAKISRKIREIFFRFTPLVEPLSLDEAFLDVTGCRAHAGSAVAIGREIQQTILDETGLVASVGIAPNKFLAKIASDLDKPNGFVFVNPEQISEFLDPLPVGRIWGVGKSTAKVFERLRVETIRDLRAVSCERLQQLFGRQGEHFYQLARGIDARKVVPDREAKSISHERTFPEDISEVELLRAWIIELSEQVARRLRRHQLNARTVHLKLRFGNFQTLSRSQTLDQPTNVTAVIRRIALGQLKSCLPGKAEGVRLLGVGVSHFSGKGGVQRTLFDNTEEGEPEATVVRQQQLDQAADEIVKRFGIDSLSRGSGIMHQLSKQKVNADRDALKD